QDRVEQVDEQVGQQEDDHQDGHEADHRGRVLAQDALVELVSDALDVEDPLGDDGAAHQVADVDAEEGDHGDQAVAQQMTDGDPALGQALGDGGADVVGAGVLADRGPGEPGGVGERDQGQHDGRQHQLVPGRVPGDRDGEDLPLHGEQVL